MDKRLADLLVHHDVLSRTDVQRKILKSKALKMGVVAQLFTDPKIDDKRIAEVLSEYLSSPVIDESSFEINPTALQFISKKMAQKNGVLPFSLNAAGDKLTVAIFDPESANEVMNTLKTATGNSPEIRIARKSWLEKAIRHYYFGEEWANKPTPKAQKLERKPKKAGLKLPAPKSNTIARLKPKRRMVLTPVDMKIPQGTHEQSEEIVLSEVSFGTAFDVFEDDPPPPVETQPRKSESKTKSKKKPAKTQRKSTHPASMVDQALNEFDSFLESQNGLSQSPLVDPNVSNVPGWTSAPSNASSSNFFGGFDEEPEMEKNMTGFDLFSEVEDESTQDPELVKCIEKQAKQIDRLQKDLTQQRSIIQALIDILSEERIVSKREIKKRISK